MKKGRHLYATQVELDRWLAEGRLNGICECGCGEKTPIAETTRQDRHGNYTQFSGHPKPVVPGHGYAVRRTGPPKLEYTDPKGYVWVKASSHPRATKTRGYVRKHILVMEDHLGRYLKKDPSTVRMKRNDEVVHHIDGDPSNNELGNLQLMTHGEHMRLHRKDSGRVEGGGQPRKLTPEQVAEMQELRLGGASLTQIAKHYGISVGLASMRCRFGYEE